MKKVWENTIMTSWVHWEFLMQDNQVIVGWVGMTSHFFMLDSKIFDKNAIPETYNLPSVEAHKSNCREMLDFKKSKNGIYKAKLAFVTKWHQWRGMNTVTFLDLETWAHYYSELYWITTLLKSLQEGHTTKINKDSLMATVTFHHRMGKIYLEFVTNELLSEIQILENKLKVTEYIPVSKLKLWHKYKKKNNKMDWPDCYVFPFYKWTLEKCIDVEEVIPWGYLCDLHSRSIWFKNAKFYDEKPIDKLDYKRMVLEHNIVNSTPNAWAYRDNTGKPATKLDFNF